MQRRTWLQLGVGSAAILAIAGTGLALMSPGLDKTGGLDGAGRTVFTAVGHAVLDGSLPKDDGPRQLALNAMVQRIDRLTRALPPHAQVELSQLLAILSSTAGRVALAGLSTDWPDASVVQIQQAMQGMRVSSLDLKRQAYAALHDITGAAYFSDASTWSQLGYPGPIKI
jgi:hypothetical protein